jgi:hypothetical protein
MQKNMKILIEEANRKVLDIMLSAEPYWVGMRPAIDAIPGMNCNTILHSGPPIEWERMAEVQKKGIIGGIRHEGLASTNEEAVRLIQDGQIEIRAAADLGVAGPGVGIVAPSMPVNICRDMTTGKEGYCIPFEGRVGLGAWGVYNDEVERNLRSIEDVLAPSVDRVLTKSGGINVKRIIAQGLQMNDETHTRQVAEGLLLVSEIIPLLVKSDMEKDLVIQCMDTLISTERWFHPLGIASSMSILAGIKGIEYSTVVSVMCGNGVEFGIKISSLGDKWFTAPSPSLFGKYLSPRWGPDDAIPWVGDSCVTEAVGLGGFAAAAAPAVVRLRGLTYRDGVQQTEEMKNICIGINHNYPIPLLDFSGPPIGIDIRKVVQTGIVPISHGGIISKEGGQIGAGATRLPFECFTKALYVFAETYRVSGE